MTVYFDDVEVGKRELVGTYEVPEAEAVAFARTWEPQPQHVDAAAARDSIFGGLTCASLYLFAVITRLHFDRPEPMAVLAMLGKDEIRLPHPARPGQRLAYHSECVEKRPSSSRPDRGVVSLRETLTDPDGQVVLSQKVTLMVSRDPARS